MTPKATTPTAIDSQALQGSDVEDGATVPKSAIIEGSLDLLTIGKVAGWAFNPASPEEPVAVEVLADGVLVARALASDFRGDLLAAGIGNGKHGFQIELPSQLIDGLEHTIDVRAVPTGDSLHGAPMTFGGGLVADAFDAQLDGAALVGWADLPRHDGTVMSVQVLEGDDTVVSGESTSDADAPNRVHFRLSLPEECFDGRPHAFSIVSDNPPWLLAQVALILPGQLTPADALQRFAREGLTPELSTVPGLRYAALSSALAAMQSTATPETMKSDLDLLIHCHATLVRGAQATDRDFAPLRFPHVSKPKVSIVIPVHNKFEVTYVCLASLLLASNRASFEVIVVDDGSIDESEQIPELIEGITYLRNDEAKGFVLACNRGGAAARGEYIVMLNNDTEVTTGWLDELLWPFDHFDSVGMTGAKLLYPTGRLQEAGGIVWGTGDPWNYGRHANPHDPRFNYTRQVDYLSGACIMLPTVLWKDLGGFDEAFIPAYFEDTDLAFRVRNKGLKTVYAPKAQVIHYEGVSSGTSTASGMKRFQEVNRPKFKSRWVLACRNNGKVGTDVDLNKDRNVSLRALVIDVETPQPDKNAGGFAAVQELRLLQALGFKCTFLPVNLAWLGHYTEQLQRMGIECIHAPFALTANSVLEKRGAEFDLIYITRYNVAEQCIDAVRKHAPLAKVVLNNADLHFLRELRAGLAAGSRELISRAVQTRDSELAVMRKVDLVLSYTDVEKAVILSHNLDSTQMARCPWVANVVPDVPEFAGRTDIAFLGGFNHHPNAEAVLWFVAEVLPRLRKVRPDIRFRVYGSNMPKSFLTLAEEEEGLVIGGWVPTVDAVYNACRLFVAPLRSGAGIKGKVVDALAHGVPCVLSPLAAEGIPLRDGMDACIADEPGQWVEAIVKLYDDEAAWSDMSKLARMLAQRHYGFDKGVLEMQDALRQAEIFTSPDNLALALDRTTHPRSPAR
jgi:GT2 family glycosyltransferase/glycosyltransferase involved in cell wall biosynthesis